jgi:hypothetical protein
VDHVLPGVLEQPGVLGRQAHRRAVVVDRLDAREEARVEVDRVGVRRQLRRHLGLDRVERVVGVGPGHRAERGIDPAEHPPRALERDDRVGERRRLGIGLDRLDLRALDGHRLLERGLVVAVPDLAEVGRAERQRPVLGEHAGGLRNGDS